MAKFITKTFNDITFGSYSERGIIAYLMFRVLPLKLAEFLTTIQFPQGVESPFVGAAQTDLRDILIFSELHFGNQGFGEPDGAVFFLYKDEKYFIFLEGKANESYKTSCKVRKRRKTTKNKNLDAIIEGSTSATPAGEAQEVPKPKGKQFVKGYNSTIRGQLELRYRMVRLYKYYPEEAFEPLTFNNNLDALFEGAGEGRRSCLREIESMKAFYRDEDEFYSHAERTDPTKLRSWRRLNIKDGVEKVFAPIKGTPENHILFLSFTTDTTNPFDTMDTALQPRFFDSSWNDQKGRFPWIGSLEIENRWNEL